MRSAVESAHILDRLLQAVLSVMDALVPPDVTAELTQILSNLVLGDNEIRSKYVSSRLFHFSSVSSHFSLSAEAVVDERLAHRPDVYLLALTQFATRPDTVEVVCHPFLSMPVSSILILSHRCAPSLLSSFDASSSALPPVPVQNLLV